MITHRPIDKTLQSFSNVGLLHRKTLRSIDAVAEIRGYDFMVSLIWRNEVVIHFPVQPIITPPPSTVHGEVSRAFGPGSVGIKTSQHTDVLVVSHSFQLLQDTDTASGQVIVAGEVDH